VHSSKIPSPTSNCRESSAWFLTILGLFTSSSLRSSSLPRLFFYLSFLGATLLPLLPSLPSIIPSSFYYSFFFLPPSLISLPYFLSFSSFGSKCSLFLSLPLINFLSLSGFSSLYVHTCNCMEILTYSILFSFAFFFSSYSVAEEACI
jgi:hypothetical protein